MKIWVAFEQLDIEDYAAERRQTKGMAMRLAIPNTTRKALSDEDFGRFKVSSPTHVVEDTTTCYQVKVKLLLRTSLSVYVTQHVTQSILLADSQREE